MPRSYSPPAMATRANNSSSGGQSSIILRASERGVQRDGETPEHTRSATALLLLLLLTTRASRQSLPGMVSPGLSSVRIINPLNISISADAGELCALVVRCVDAPADSLWCVALEMRRGGGEKQEEEEE